MKKRKQERTLDHILEDLAFVRQQAREASDWKLELKCLEMEEKYLIKRALLRAREEELTLLATMHQDVAGYGNGAAPLKGRAGAKEQKAEDPAVTQFLGSLRKGSAPA